MVWWLHVLFMAYGYIIDSWSSGYICDLRLVVTCLIYGLLVTCLIYGRVVTCLIYGLVVICLIYGLVVTCVIYDLWLHI